MKIDMKLAQQRHSDDWFLVEKGSVLCLDFRFYAMDLEIFMRIFAEGKSIGVDLYKKWPS